MEEAINISLSDYQKTVKERGVREDIKFKCPICGGSQSINDFKKLDLKDEEIDGIFYFSCIGRWNDGKNLDGKECNYTSGGLFKMNTVFVEHGEEKTGVFDFSDNPLNKEALNE